MELTNKVYEITSNTELTGIFEEFKANAPIKWEKHEVAIKPGVNEFQAYDICSFTIKNFSGTLKQVEEFLEYVDKYNKIVRIDSLNFKKSVITGTLNGEARLLFYFKKSAI